MLLPLMAKTIQTRPIPVSGMVIWENVRSAQVEPWAVSVTDYVRRNK